MILTIFLAYFICVVTAEQPYVHFDPQELTIVKGQSVSIDFTYHGHLKNKIELLLHNSPELSVKPNKIGFDWNNNVSKVHIHGLAVTSRAFVDVGKCREDAEPGTEVKCDLSTERVFATVKVVHSNFIAILVYICGFIFSRKSVIGLNFDFLILNVIGFSCYTVYNFMFYFNKNVQENFKPKFPELYLSTHPRNLIPVLINDVIFAGHALFVCLVTGFQCFIYERGNQRVSYICRGWSSLLWINWLQFIYYLSYVKMAVTLSKYLPQAILNYKRKSTVGWSIGNVLLDFAGGVTDVFQMVLQALNTNDWSVFSGNPVKVGIGSTSIFFDIFFIVQHYVLYRQREEPQKA
uniref:Cystinosin n=1 Tax=Ditylenchus dipsaci TaxID=166011 RepID=A0A915E5G0_9BILA